VPKLPVARVGSTDGPSRPLVGGGVTIANAPLKAAAATRIATIHITCSRRRTAVYTIGNSRRFGI
jgi:hypothetical protein